MSSSPPTKIGFVNWSDLTPSFQESIFDLIKSPSLTFLHIGNIYGLPSTFLRNTRLEHLHLSHTEFSSPEQISRGVRKRRTYASSIGMRHHEPCRLSHRHCWRLFIPSHPPQDFYVNHILCKPHGYYVGGHESLGRSIEALQLDFYGESSNFIVFLLIMTTNMQKVFLRPLNLSTWGQMPKLQNLAVTHTVLMPDEEVEITTARTFDEDVEHIFALLDTPTPRLL